MADKHPFTDGVTTISPWQPESDPVMLAALGKLSEELGEASARVARCIIHGINETDPDSSRTNREELCRELADVEAGIQALGLTTDLSISTVRRQNKVTGFRNWFRLIQPTAS